jgi:hypothetical protein
MKFMIPFLIAMLLVASVAQSLSGDASGVPSVAIPKTTEVLVIQTPKQEPGVAIAHYRGRTHATASPSSKRVSLLMIVGGLVTALSQSECPNATT